MARLLYLLIFILMRIAILLILLAISLPTYADDTVSSSGGWSGWSFVVSSWPVSWAWWPSMSMPIVDMTLVKLLPFSIFDIKL